MYYILIFNITVLFLGDKCLQLPLQYQLGFEAQTTLKNQASVLHRLDMSKLKAYV